MDTFFEIIIIFKGISLIWGAEVAFLEEERDEHLRNLRDIRKSYRESIKRIQDANRGVDC